MIDVNDWRGVLEATRQEDLESTNRVRRKVALQFVDDCYLRTYRVACTRELKDPAPLRTGEKDVAWAIIYELDKDIACMQAAPDWKTDIILQHALSIGARLQKQMVNPEAARAR